MRRKEVIKFYNQHLINKIYDLQDLIGDNVLNNIIPNPDILILCFSEPWIPKRYHPLFFLILDLLNKYYDTHFSICQGESEMSTDIDFT